MVFEEEAAYALLSWKRFDSAVTNELTHAVTSAFALVAVADGDLAQSEVARFSAMLKEHADVFSVLEFSSVERLFRDICSAIISDPVTGRQHALASLSDVSGNIEHCELVRSAAEIALVADGRELGEELAVLEDICNSLGIETQRSQLS